MNKPSTVRKSRSVWYWMLLLPYLGLLFPQIYARTTPTLWGVPFFYWYQFSWVILSSVITGLVYLMTSPRASRRSNEGPS